MKVTGPESKSNTENNRPLPLVSAVDVSLTYGSGAQAVVAVHRATCEVMAGQRIALVGASGSGKSTLLHLFAGLERPTLGTVTWPALGGRPLGWPRSVGVVFQGPSLIPALDVVENVALPLVLNGEADDVARERAQQALEQLGITALGAALPDELSGGQAQRVAVARVLASRPRLVLADEPTGQLDRITADTVVEVLLKAVADLGAALVVATHDGRVADRLDDVWHMSDGRLHLRAPAPQKPLAAGERS